MCNHVHQHVALRFGTPLSKVYGTFSNKANTNYQASSRLYIPFGMCGFSGSHLMELESFTRLLFPCALRTSSLASRGRYISCGNWAIQVVSACTWFPHTADIHEPCYCNRRTHLHNSMGANRRNDIQCIFDLCRCDTYILGAEVRTQYTFCTSPSDWVLKQMHVSARFAYKGRSTALCHCPVACWSRALCVSPAASHFATGTPALPRFAPRSVTIRGGSEPHTRVRRGPLMTS